MWYQNIRSASFSFVAIHASVRRTNRQTDGQNCDSNRPTVRCITCRTVKTSIVVLLHTKQLCYFLFICSNRHNTHSDETRIQQDSKARACTNSCPKLTVKSYTIFCDHPLTLSPPIPLRLYTLPYWSYPRFLIFDIRALWRSGLSARAPECQKLKIVG